MMRFRPGLLVLGGLAAGRAEDAPLACRTQLAGIEPATWRKDGIVCDLHGAARQAAVSRAGVAIYA